jgi:hypothetical protein
MSTHRLAAGTRRLVACAWLIGLVLSAIQTTGAQTLSVSADPGTLKITTAFAGSPPNDAVNSTTTYTVAVRNKNRPQKIVAELDAAMPVGTTLTIDLSPVNKSTGVGPVSLTTTPQDLVVAISNTSHRTAAITYTFSASSAAGVIPSSTRTVTFTLLAYP